jgi:hypothetical protein
MQVFFRKLLSVLFWAVVSVILRFILFAVISAIWKAHLQGQFNSLELELIKESVSLYTHLHIHINSFDLELIRELIAPL